MCFGVTGGLVVNDNFSSVNGGTTSDISVFDSLRQSVWSVFVLSMISSICALTANQIGSVCVGIFKTTRYIPINEIVHY